MLIALYEQAGAVASADLRDNHPITEGEGVISGIPPQPAGAPIDIWMSVDVDGRLGVRARERASGQVLQIQITVGVLSDAAVDAAADAVARMRVTG